MEDKKVEMTKLSYVSKQFHILFSGGAEVYTGQLPGSVEVKCSQFFTKRMSYEDWETAKNGEIHCSCKIQERNSNIDTKYFHDLKKYYEDNKNTLMPPTFMDHTA